MKPRVKIDFYNDKKYPELTLSLYRTVRRAIRAALLEEGFPYPVRVSVTFCDNEYIHALNREHRGVDRPTDVLSFPLYEDGDFSSPECARECALGDIVLSLERAREQAEEIGNSFLREVAFLCIHSTLHLLGYDHERSPEEDARQCERQTAIINTLKFK